jgi:hypothetical protein
VAAWIQGSWSQLEHWASRCVSGIRGEAKLLSARADCLQQALRLSEGIAAYRILQDFRELDLRDVVNDIVELLRQCLIIMISSTGGGALIGGLAGGIGGAGVGAIPGVALGAAAGAQLGEWILIVMGLKALTEFIVKGMPEISHAYWDGIRQSWLAATPPRLPQQPVPVDGFAVQHAAEKIARGHVAMFVLLLMGIVAYLAKGRGSMADLAETVRGSKAGPRFAQWMVSNEDKLRVEPRLRAPEASTNTAATPRESAGPPARVQPRGRVNPPREIPSKASEGDKALPENSRFGNVPNEITTSSGIVIKPTNGKTTTVLGSYSSDMDNIINGKLAYPKTTDFGAKSGGYNVLNVPDTMFASRTPDQFWNEVNAPFLDSAMQRGDPIYIATKPSAAVLLKADGSLTGFGREIKYLTSNGYTYNSSTGLMTKP